MIQKNRINQCAVCGEAFDKPETLRGHRRRVHVIEAKVTLGEYHLGVLCVAGSFTCPLVECKQRCTNIDTFKNHMKKQHNADVSVLANETNGSHKRAFREELENFDFGRGTKRALCDQEPEKARLLAAGLGCEPVALHFSHIAVKEGLRVTGLFDTKTVKLLATNLPFHDDTRSLPVDVIIQLHKEEKSIIATASQNNITNQRSIGVLKDVRLSSLPGLMDRCNYLEPDQDLIRLLNIDFRLTPSLLYAVAKLHTGSLVSCGDEIVLLLTCEAYSRSKATDTHSETSMKSMPISSTSIFVGICEESDGGMIKRKLKIGGRHMNILSTMSARVGLAIDVNIGPETNMCDGQLAIFYPEGSIKEFKAAMEQSTHYMIPPDVNSLRQLVSGFGDASTYKPYRASMEMIASHETLMPATVFNLCDLPHNENYGVSDTAAPKIGSRFLNIIAAASLLNKYSISKTQFQEALQFFHANKTHKSQQWRVLCDFVDALESDLEKNQEIDILAFGRKYAGSLADMINQTLATANRQIKINVVKKLMCVYGRREDC